jgi:hypothetical protein
VEGALSNYNFGLHSESTDTECALCRAAVILDAYHYKFSAVASWSEAKYTLWFSISITPSFVCSFFITASHAYYHNPLNLGLLPWAGFPCDYQEITKIEQPQKQISQ